MSTRKPRKFKLLIAVWASPDEPGWCDRGFLYDSEGDRLWFGPMSTSPDQFDPEGISWKNHFPWVDTGTYEASFDNADIPMLAFKGKTPSRTAYDLDRVWDERFGKLFVCGVIPGSESDTGTLRGSEGHITVAPSHAVAFFSFFGKGDVVDIVITDAIALHY